VPIELTTENIQSTVMENDIVIIDFWAPWCGPCQSFAPVYDKVSAEHEDIVFAKVNTEDQQQLAAEFNIRSIPTLMVFREQIIIFAQPGAVPEAGLTQLIEQVKSLDMDKVKEDIAKEQAAQSQS
jgi:thioredoxin 1